MELALLIIGIIVQLLLGLEPLELIQFPHLQQRIMAQQLLLHL